MTLSLHFNFHKNKYVVFEGVMSPPEELGHSAGVGQDREVHGQGWRPGCLPLVSISLSFKFDENQSCFS